MTATVMTQNTNKQTKKKENFKITSRNTHTNTYLLQEAKIYSTNNKVENNKEKYQKQKIQ